MKHRDGSMGKVGDETSGASNSEQLGDLVRRIDIMVGLATFKLWLSRLVLFVKSCLHRFGLVSPSHTGGLKLILKMQSVRVYGSNSRYGREPQQNPLGAPIIVTNFPSDREAIEVLLGEPPTTLFEAHRRKTAMANITLDMMFGRRIQISDEYTFDDAIKDQLKNEITVPVPKSYPWYVTISVQRDIELNEDLIFETEFPLAKIPAETKFREFHDYAKPFADHLAAIVSTVIGAEFFEHVIFDEVLFSDPTGIITRIPERQDFKMSARASVGKPLESCDIAALRKLLSSERLGMYARNRWLEGAMHWYAAMLNEPDHWKAFQYAFLSLEIVTHKVSKRLLDSLVDSFAFKKADGELVYGIPMAELLGDKNRLTLVAKFCIMALGLSSSTAEADVQTFKDAKEARDRFSHGDIRNERELPLHSVKDLCSRYLEAVFNTANL
jgi:hypothetical protein